MEKNVISAWNGGIPQLYATPPFSIFIQTWVGPQNTTYKELPQCMSPSLELGLSRPLSHQRVCPSPGSKGGEAHSRAGEGLGESRFQRLEKKLSTLPTLWVGPTVMYWDWTTEYTQSGNGHFLAYIPSWCKNQEGMGRKTLIFLYNSKTYSAEMALFIFKTLFSNF